MKKHWFVATIAMLVLLTAAVAQSGRKRQPAQPLGVLNPERVICWIADGRIEKIAQPSEIDFGTDEFDEH